MKRLFTLALAFAWAHCCLAQSDRHGNPVFNSVLVSEESIGEVQLLANYYTLRNNIENRGSSVFVAHTPNLNQVREAAVKLPADFFVLTRARQVVCMILLVNQPTRRFVVVTPRTGEQQEYPCRLKGDLTENRAREIAANGYDPAAVLEKGHLVLGGSTLKVIPSRQVRAEVLRLIRSEKLAQLEAGSTRILSGQEAKAFVLAESQKGGKLDYFTAIQGKEYDGIQIKPGVFTTNLGAALYRWGKATAQLGINTVEDALAIFAEFRGRALNGREQEYIKLGFAEGLQGK
jgi:hypothetical protein